MNFDKPSDAIDAKSAELKKERMKRMDLNSPEEDAVKKTIQDNPKMIEYNPNAVSSSDESGFEMGDAETNVDERFRMGGDEKVEAGAEGKEKGPMELYIELSNMLDRYAVDSTLSEQMRKEASDLRAELNVIYSREASTLDEVTGKTRRKSKNEIDSEKFLRAIKDLKSNKIDSLVEQARRYKAGDIVGYEKPTEQGKVEVVGVEPENWNTLKEKHFPSPEGTRAAMRGGREFGEVKDLDESKLTADLEDARTAYARADLKARGVFSNLKRVLGEHFTGNAQDVPDVVKLGLAYQEKLKALKDFKINKLKEKYRDIDNLPAGEKEQRIAEMKKDMKDMVKYFNYDGKLELYEARTNAGAKEREGTATGKIMEAGSNLVNKYRKMGWKKKLLLSGALLAGGFAVAGLGSASAIAVIGAAKIGQRILGGAMAGTGVAMGMERRARKKQENQSEAGAEEMLKNFENEGGDWEATFAAFSSKLDGEIKTYDDSLKNERSAVKKRTAAGLVVGGLLAGGAAGWVFKHGFGWAKDIGGKLIAGLGTTDPAMVDGFHAGSEANMTGLDAEHSAPSSMSEKLVPGSVDEMVDNYEPKAGTGVISEHIAVRGDNVEKMMIHEKMAEGMSRPDAERLAHQIALNSDESLKELGKIRPGDKVITDWEHGKVKVIHASDMSGHHGVDHDTVRPHTGATEVHRAGMGNLAEHAQEKPTAGSILEDKGVPEPIHETAQVEGLRNNGVEDLNQAGPTPEESAKYQKIYGTGSAEVLKNVYSMPKFTQLYQGEMLLAGGLKAAAEEAYNRALHDTNDVSGMRAEDLRIAKENYESAYKNVFNKIAKNIFRGSGINGFDDLRNISADEFMNSKAGMNPKMAELVTYVSKQFGENVAMPKSGESTLAWTNRIIIKTLESGGVELKDYKILDTGRG